MRYLGWNQPYSIMVNDGGLEKFARYSPLSMRTEAWAIDDLYEDLEAIYGDPDEGFEGLCCKPKRGCR